jgi:phosphatidylglycerol:prolipoprotein diacylglycerol transferase
MVYWDPNPNLFIIPVLNWPIKWYGCLFALGFTCGFFIFRATLFRYLCLEKPSVSPNLLKKMAGALSDQIILYGVVGTVIGARLGHFLFYESPSDYLSRPWEIVQVWKGGLASHGAAIGICLALYLYCRKVKEIPYLRLLDFVSVPAALAGGFIRLGNLINQEILGTPTQLPWGFVFGHPADGSFLTGRHPVQLYESFFYFTLFIFLWYLARQPKYLLRRGFLIGLFLTSVFCFRFLVEFIKLEQSSFFSMFLTMGQWLSIPFIVAGIVLIRRSNSG